MHEAIDERRRHDLVVEDLVLKPLLDVSTVDARSQRRVINRKKSIAPVRVIGGGRRPADPADHFGQIDVAIDLRGLRPGRYAVRLTLTAGAHTSVKAEPIVVVAAAGGSAAVPGHSA